MNETLTTLLANLRESGLRLTKPRQQVVNVFARERRPLTIAEVHRRVEKGRAHLASVYRAVEALCRLGVLARVDRVDEGQRYELSDRYRKHHHHLICQACGRVEDFEDCAGDAVEKRILKRTRFRVIKHEMRFLGICEACAA